MKYLILTSLLSIAFSCQYSGFTDLTPDDGFNTEFAFNVPALNRAISTEDSKQDTGWHVTNDVPILVINPFVKDVQFISTDTFAFEWHDYEPVMQEIHRIANNFDITNSIVSRNYRWLNVSQMYSSSDSYLIPMFNSDGQRYWLQVFREKVSWFSYYYTARGIWPISKPKKIDGDVS